MSNTGLIYVKEAMRAWKYHHTPFISLVFLVLAVVLAVFGFNLKDIVGWSFLLFAVIGFLISFFYFASFVRRKIRLRNVRSLDDILKLGPFEAEEALLNCLGVLGFKTKKTQPTLDKGLDGIAKKDRVRYAVQCKRYKKTNYISWQDMKKFVRDMHRSKFANGIFITTSYFARPAREIAEEENVVMIDGRDIAGIF